MMSVSIKHLLCSAILIPLDDQVVHHILSNLPDLQERILSAVHSLEAETAVKKAA